MARIASVMFSCVAFIMVWLGGACSPRPVVEATGDGFEHAVALHQSGDDDGALAALKSALTADPGACQRALLEPAFHSGFRDTREFRSAIRNAAATHRISRLILVSKDEPGEWIEIEGQVVDARNAPVPGAIVDLFATDHAGRYHPVIEGETTPRIFGTVVADQDGRFWFGTVRPGPYPGTRNARHIHMSVEAARLRLAVPQYAVFDDDLLLDEPQNHEPRGEAIRIAMTTVDGRARGRMVLPMK